MLTPAWDVEKSAEEEKAYQDALDLLAKKQNTKAASAFHAFVKKYPQGTYTPNAHYWLGELYTLQGKSVSAAKEFEIVISQYPKHAKVPDAMLRLAIIHKEAGQSTQAQQELKKIIQKYPDSSAARLATARLQQTT